MSRNERDVRALLAEAADVALTDPALIERLRLIRLVAATVNDHRRDVWRLTYLLADAGWSVAAVAEYVGVDEKRVRLWARRHAQALDLPPVWGRRRIDGPIHHLGYQPGGAVLQQPQPSPPRRD